MASSERGTLLKKLRNSSGALQGAGFFGCQNMFDSLEVKVLFINAIEMSDSGSEVCALRFTAQ